MSSRRRMRRCAVCGARLPEGQMLLGQSWYCCPCDYAVPPWRQGRPPPEPHRYWCCSPEHMGLYRQRLIEHDCPLEASEDADGRSD